MTMSSSSSICNNLGTFVSLHRSHIDDKLPVVIHQPMTPKSLPALSVTTAVGEQDTCIAQAVYIPLSQPQDLPKDQCEYIIQLMALKSLPALPATTAVGEQDARITQAVDVPLSQSQDLPKDRYITQPMTLKSFPALPAKSFDKIVSYLSKKDVTEMFRVCRDWRNNCIPILNPKAEERYLNDYMEFLLEGIKYGSPIRYITKNLLLELESFRIEKFNKLIEDNKKDIEANLRLGDELILKANRSQRWYVRERERIRLSQELKRAQNPVILEIVKNKRKEITRLLKHGYKKITGLWVVSLPEEPSQDPMSGPVYRYKNQEIYEIQEIIEKFLNKKLDLSIKREELIAIAEKQVYDVLFQYKTDIAKRVLPWNRRLTKAAVSYCGAALKLSPREFRDFEIVDIAAASFGLSLIDAIPEFQDNFVPLIKAVKQTGIVFMDLSKRWQNNRLIAMIAISQDVRMRKYVSDRLKKDVELALATAVLDGRALQDFEEELINDFNFINRVVSENIYAWLHLPKKFKLEGEIVKTILEATKLKSQIVARHWFINQLRDILRSEASLPEDECLYSRYDKIETMKVLVSYDGLELEHLSEEFRDHDKIVELAFNNNPLALKFASPRLRYKILGVDED